MNSREREYRDQAAIVQDEFARGRGRNEWGMIVGLAAAAGVGLMLYHVLGPSFSDPKHTLVVSGIGGVVGFVVGWFIGRALAGLLTLLLVAAVIFGVVIYVIGKVHNLDLTTNATPAQPAAVAPPPVSVPPAPALPALPR
jgi:hypothetical protein